MQSVALHKDCDTNAMGVKKERARLEWLGFEVKALKEFNSENRGWESSDFHLSDGSRQHHS